MKQRKLRLIKKEETVQLESYATKPDGFEFVVMILAIVTCAWSFACALELIAMKLGQ